MKLPSMPHFVSGEDLQQLVSRVQTYVHDMACAVHQGHHFVIAPQSVQNNGYV